MVKATVKHGVFVPSDPLPHDWREGTEVQVEKPPSETGAVNGVHPADAWMDAVERCAADQDPADDLRLEHALDEERRIAKEFARQGKI